MLIPEVVLVEGHGQDDDVTTPSRNLRVVLDPSALVKLIGETSLRLPATSDATGLLALHSQVFLVVLIVTMVWVSSGVVIFLCMFIRLAVAGCSLGRTLKDN